MVIAGVQVDVETADAHGISCVALWRVWAQKDIVFVYHSFGWNMAKLIDE